jgi:type II secretory pathway pseudopilin PulG
MKIMHSFTGPRAVPARSAQEQASVVANSERLGAVVVAASRDGSRSAKADALRSRAFTLIELVLVVGLLVIWAAMLAPGLAHTRPNVRVIQCLSNKRQIQLACAMYAADHNDIMVPNPPVSLDGRNGWCNGSMLENWTMAAGNTNPAGYLTNCLAPYVAGDLKVYKCPGDTIPSDNGQRMRSVGMNGQMGAFYTSGGNGYNSGWRVYVKVSDLNKPSPAMAWVFCDESMYTLNDGFLQMNLNSPDYPDIPAAYHGGVNCFSFGDGHVEAHKWKWKGATGVGLMNCPYAYGYTGSHWGSSVQDKDWLWLQARSSVRM